MGPNQFIHRAASTACLVLVVACGGNASTPGGTGDPGAARNTDDAKLPGTAEYAGVPEQVGSTTYPDITGEPTVNSDPSAGPESMVYLRLRNRSRVNFDNIFVEVEQRIDFGALAAGADSEYKPADGIFSYAYVDGTSGADHYLIQPIDFVGEEPLSAGYYTYALSVSATARGGDRGSLNLRLLTDPPPAMPGPP